MSAASQGCAAPMNLAVSNGTMTSSTSDLQNLAPDGGPLDRKAAMMAAIASFHEKQARKQISADQERIISQRYTNKTPEPDERPVSGVSSTRLGPSNLVIPASGPTRHHPQSELRADLEFLRVITDDPTIGVALTTPSLAAYAVSKPPVPRRDSPKRRPRRVTGTSHPPRPGSRGPAVTATGRLSKPPFDPEDVAQRVTSDTSANDPSRRTFERPSAVWTGRLRPRDQTFELPGPPVLPGHIQQQEKAARARQVELIAERDARRAGPFSRRVGLEEAVAGGSAAQARRRVLLELPDGTLASPTDAPPSKQGAHRGPLRVGAATRRLQEMSGDEGAALRDAKLGDDDGNDGRSNGSSSDDDRPPSPPREDPAVVLARVARTTVRSMAGMDDLHARVAALRAEADAVTVPPDRLMHQPNTTTSKSFIEDKVRATAAESEIKRREADAKDAEAEYAARVEALMAARSVHDDHVSSNAPARAATQRHQTPDNYQRVVQLLDHAAYLREMSGARVKSTAHGGYTSSNDGSDGSQNADEELAQDDNVVHSRGVPATDEEVVLRRLAELDNTRNATTDENRRALDVEMAKAMGELPPEVKAAVRTAMGAPSEGGTFIPADGQEESVGPWSSATPATRAAEPPAPSPPDIVDLEREAAAAARHLRNIDEERQRQRRLADDAAVAAKLAADVTDDPCPESTKHIETAAMLAAETAIGMEADAERVRQQRIAARQRALALVADTHKLDRHSSRLGDAEGPTLGSHLPSDEHADVSAGPGGPVPALNGPQTDNTSADDVVEGMSVAASQVPESSGQPILDPTKPLVGSEPLTTGSEDPSGSLNVLSSASASENTPQQHAAAEAEAEERFRAEQDAARARADNIRQSAEAAAAEAAIAAEREAQTRAVLEAPSVLPAGASIGQHGAGGGAGGVSKVARTDGSDTRAKPQSPPPSRASVAGAGLRAARIASNVGPAKSSLRKKPQIFSKGQEKTANPPPRLLNERMARQVARDELKVILPSAGVSKNHKKREGTSATNNVEPPTGDASSLKSSAAVSSRRPPSGPSTTAPTRARAAACVSTTRNAQRCGPGMKPPADSKEVRSGVSLPPVPRSVMSPLAEPAESQPVFDASPEHPEELSSSEDETEIMSADALRAVGDNATAQLTAANLSTMMKSMKKAKHKTKGTRAAAAKMSRYRANAGTGFESDASDTASVVSDVSESTMSSATSARSDDSGRAPVLTREAIKARASTMRR
eukprot:TRINITY_DN21908_c0_g1_i1.p1 TRINITY_DN21908_c0_g1~~TRINITY_DN21908_c0_g1_i1.p1  ORF type:complete len:1241 (-),score=130.26 TRINITY_DN21908_c0_g1_i1:51-3773(-)